MQRSGDAHFHLFVHIMGTSGRATLRGEIWCAGPTTAIGSAEYTVDGRTYFAPRSSLPAGDDQPNDH